MGPYGASRFPHGGLPVFKFKLGAREPEQGWFDGTMLLTSIARKIVRLLLVITIAAAGGSDSNSESGWRPSVAAKLKSSPCHHHDAAAACKFGGDGH